MRSDQQGRGIGRALMHDLITYARADALQELRGTVLSSDHTMLSLVRSLGFRVAHDPDGFAAEA